jgi:hypothetical protein
MKCAKCGNEFGDVAGYQLIRLAVTWNFCGRLCLIEHLAPELKKVCVPEQWIPTPDEEERMRQ